MTAEIPTMYVIVQYYTVGYQIAEMLHDWYIVFQAPYM